ncbi:MAG: ArnT family glycosyltransferase [Chloroflexota bacterium]
MSSRLGYWIAVLLLLLAATLRISELIAVPVGLSEGEIINIRIAESAREGNIEVFYDLGGEGREGLYQIAMAFVTSIIGNGPLGYRLFSVWLGLLALAMVYAAGRRLTGPLGGVAAMGLLTVSFWPILLSRLIKPETVLPLLIATVLLCLSLALPIYRRRRKRGDNNSVSALLGLVLGLGIYIHPIGLLVLVFSLAIIVFMVRTRQQIFRRRLSYIGFMLLITMILSVPYLVSSIRHPNLGGIERLTGDSGHISLESPIRGVSGMIFQGDDNPLRNLPHRPLFDPVSAVLIVAGIGIAIVKWRQPRTIMLLIPAVILSPVFLLSAQAPNFDNYASLLPLLALFFGLAIATVYGHLNNPIPRRLLLSGLLLLLIFNTIVTLRDLFVEWSGSDDVELVYNGRLGALAHHVDRTADTEPTLICGWRADQSPTAQQLNDAQLITLMMNRQQGANVRYANCTTALVIIDGGRHQQVILPDPAILENAHPEVLYWLDMGTLLTSPDLPEQSVLALQVEQALADRGGQLTANPSVAYPPEASTNSDELVATPISFGGNLTLLGYISEAVETYQPGGTLTLATYWRTQGRVPPDLRLFTHILADPGASPPANTDVTHVNPRFLRDRDVFLQVTAVPLPESLPEGVYRLSIGGYQDSSDDRLSVLDNGEARGTRLFLNTITVEAGS